MKIMDLPPRHRDGESLSQRLEDVTPPGNSHDYQKKEVAGRAFCKNMKTKGREDATPRLCLGEEREA